MVTYPFHYDPPKLAMQDIDEDGIQTLFVNRVKMLAPQVRIAASLNGMRASQWQARKAKRNGMSSGFPDVELFWRGGRGFIEFKSADGSLDEQQKIWLHWLHGEGYLVAVCRSPDTALEVLRSWGAPFVGRVAA